MENSENISTMKGSIITKAHSKKKLGLKAITPYFYILPAFMSFSLFLFFPFIKTIALSFCVTNNMGNAKKFVGLRNYIRLFTMRGFSGILITTFKFAIIVIVLSMLLGFITANLANIKGKAFKPFSIIFSMPLAAASSGVAISFQKMFDPSSGIVNKLFHTNSKWFQDPKLALLLVAIVTVWMMSGTNFIFLTAGLKNISKDLYESADIDGAGGFSKLFHITLPGLSPILFFVLTLNIISAFQSFAQVNIITNGGPGDATNVVVFNIYRDAFFNFRFDFAAAQSVILFVIILIVTIIQFKNERKMVNYL